MLRMVGAATVKKGELRSALVSALASRALTSRDGDSDVDVVQTLFPWDRIVLVSTFEDEAEFDLIADNFPTGTPFLVLNTRSGRHSASRGVVRLRVARV